jgi:hypothetical protein
MIVYCASKVNATFPVEAPPTHVELKVPVGQTARAARTHPSHLPLLILIVAPASTALSLNSAVPEEPVVDEGDPPQNSIVPRRIKKSASKAHSSNRDCDLVLHTSDTSTDCKFCDILIMEHNIPISSISCNLKSNDGFHTQ